LYADRGIEVRPDDLGPVSTREPIIRGDSGNEIAAQYDLRLVWERARNLAMGLAELGKFTASAGFDPLDPNALEPLFHKVDQVVRLYTEYHDQIIALEKDDKTLVDATWFFLGDNALNILSETLKKPSSFGTLGPSTPQAKEEIGAVRELSKSLTGLNERNKAAEVTLEVTEWVLDAVQIAAGVYGFATVLKLAAKEAGEAAVAKGLEGIAVKQAERRAAVWAAVKELSKTGAIVAGFAGAAAGLQKLVDSKDLPPSTLVWVQAGLLALQVIPAVRARLKAAQLAEDSLSVEEHAVATSAVSNSAAIDEPAPRSTATAAENAERETTDAAAKHLEKMTTKEGQRVLRVAQNLEEGTLLEQQAKLGRQLADEVIIESQYQQGAADKGFDFLSIKGSGQNAQLFINEVKDEFGRVGSRRFTALGLGKLGLATFNQATDVAEQAIRSSANLDPQTKATVLRQLRSGGAKIRLIGSENTNFAPDVIRKIERFTGFVVEEIINSRK
jgi:hypothetical protein